MIRTVTTMENSPQPRRKASMIGLRISASLRFWYSVMMSSSSVFERPMCMAQRVAAALEGHHLLGRRVLRAEDRFAELALGFKR